MVFRNSNRISNCYNPCSNYSYVIHRNYFGLYLKVSKISRTRILQFHSRYPRQVIVSNSHDIVDFFVTAAVTNRIILSFIYWNNNRFYQTSKMIFPMGLDCSINSWAFFASESGIRFHIEGFIFELDNKSNSIDKSWANQSGCFFLKAVIE